MARTVTADNTVANIYTITGLTRIAKNCEQDDTRGVCRIAKIPSDLIGCELTEMEFDAVVKKLQLWLSGRVNHEYPDHEKFAVQVIRNGRYYNMLVTHDNFGQSAFGNSPWDKQ
jgi:hypothetical protein